MKGLSKVWVLAGWVILATGCSRQDSDCLARIGRKLAQRLDQTTVNCQEKIHKSFPRLSATSPLESRVSARLRWDKILADAAIEVHVQGKEVELKGTVKPEQKRRALELADATAGVEKVIDSLKEDSPEKKEPAPAPEANPSPDLIPPLPPLP